MANKMGGYITVITGGMFSGKTEELISRVRRAPFAKHKVQVFKSSIDTRYHNSNLVAHYEASIEAIPVEDASLLLNLISPETTIVAIDEAQFFDNRLIAVCLLLSKRGVDVLVAGLDTDFRGEPFGPMPQIMAVGDEIIKKKAYCTICGKPATRSQRLINNEPAPYDSPVKVIGGTESYQARCRKHHIVPNEPDFRLLLEVK